MLYENIKVMVCSLDNTDFTEIVAEVLQEDTLAPYLFIICLNKVFFGCRIHQILLCRGVRTPPNKCPEYDTKQSNGEIPVMLGILGNAEHPFIAIAPRSNLAWNGST